MQTSKNIQDLWDLFIADRASPEQVDRLFQSIKEANDDENMVYFREALKKSPRVPQRTDDEVVNGILRSIIPPVKHITFIQRWGWIAASVIVLATGIFFWMNRRNKTSLPSAVAAAPVIGPGSNGAVLTLSDGSQIVLDSLGNGVIASQNGARLSMHDGRLSYDPDSAGSGAMTYNSMSTPRGRQFRLMLPDGTQVWLNAASSIRYPTAFSGKERMVSVSGEAYFEVAADHNKPFLIKLPDNEAINVLGTSFNVNAYENEGDVTTTLIEGSIRVHRTSADAATSPSAITLKPGQQAQGTKIIQHADLDQALAWKNGLFNFDNASLQQIMRQLERWYNIEVVYDNGIPEISLMGEITRGVPLDDLLAALKKMGVHYKQEGRKLIILR